VEAKLHYRHRVIIDSDAAFIRQLLAEHLFYKTQNGAHVDDLFMSLIHTCQFCDANPFHYLTALQEHSELVARSPQQWMPWNYRETLMQKSSL
jgi:hypothetical protein